MVLNGMIRIDELRDHVPPIHLLIRLIGRRGLEHAYQISLPLPEDFNPSSSSSSSKEKEKEKKNEEESEKNCYTTSNT